MKKLEKQVLLKAEAMLKAIEHDDIHPSYKNDKGEKVFSAFIKAVEKYVE